jgi:hypothetical protein
MIEDKVSKKLDDTDNRILVMEWQVRPASYCLLVYLIYHLYLSGDEPSHVCDTLLKAGITDVRINQIVNVQIIKTPGQSNKV